MNGIGISIGYQQNPADAHESSWKPTEAKTSITPPADRIFHANIALELWFTQFNTNDMIEINDYNIYFSHEQNQEKQYGKSKNIRGGVEIAICNIQQKHIPNQ